MLIAVLDICWLIKDIWMHHSTIAVVEIIGNGGVIIGSASNVLSFILKGVLIGSI